jgi:uncharacterized protein (DUF1330 family)
MPAYLIALPEEIHDPSGLQEYIQQVIPLMAQFGGRYIITSFAVTPLEGDITNVGAAVAEFPSMEQLRAFWDAPAYAPLRELRQRSLRVRIMAADVPPPS